MKEFRSPGEEEVVIGLTTGHVARVGPGWRALEQRFQSQALAAGCLTRDGEEKAEVTADERDEQVMQAMRDMIKADELTKSGQPNATILSTRVGFPVGAKDRERLWAKVNAP